MKGVIAPIELEPDALATQCEPYARKFLWFLSKGYQPHLYQALFHTAESPETHRLARFRALSAGRRGGKTLAAAWEILFYLLHPEDWWRDYKGTEDVRPLWVWQVSKNYKEGRPAWRTFQQVLAQAGLIKGHDYHMNKQERTIEFPNGSFLEFRSADDEESLRGAGLHILWFDEAAIIPDAGAWNVVRPALADYMGMFIGTSTPKGRNWFHDEFFDDDADADPNIFHVEYWSIHNPHYPRQEWEYLKKTYHPLLFKQECMASFDAMIGIDLSGEWLRYYELEDLPRKADGRYDLKLYIGVDPAISQRDTADNFAMALIGVTKNNDQAYLLDTYLGKLPFPDQVHLIGEWHRKWAPHAVGIENNAYQAALSQQVSRLPGFVPVMPITNATKKIERIVAMAPFFKLGRILIHPSQRDFVDQWIGYDSGLKNPDDDLLDAVELALRATGAILPLSPDSGKIQNIIEHHFGPRTGSLQDGANKDLAELGEREMSQNPLEVFDDEYLLDW